MTEQPTNGDDQQVPGGGLEGNEEGASSDGDSGNEGAHNSPKPGNHPSDEEEGGQDR